MSQLQCSIQKELGSKSDWYTDHMTVHFMVFLSISVEISGLNLPKAKPDLF